MEQQLQSFALQKQNFQAQLNELDSAIGEIDKTNVAYKIVGNIMVLREKDELKKDLDEKKEMVSLRIKTVEKQETKMREKATEVQSTVMKSLSEAEKTEEK